MTPHTVVAGYRGSSPRAYTFAKEWQRNAEIARAYLEKASKRMKKWADENRKPHNFKVGDLVFVKLQRDTSYFIKKLHKGLVRRYEGPFRIIAQVGKVSYKLQLPRWMSQVHPVFHASKLKPYYPDMEDPSRNVPPRSGPVPALAPAREIDSIVAERRAQSHRDRAAEMEYLVKWRGLPEAEG